MLTNFILLQDLTIENWFFTALKVANFGIPCLLYGLAGKLMSKHEEIVSVVTSEHKSKEADVDFKELRGVEVKLLFWYAEDKGSPH